MKQCIRIIGGRYRGKKLFFPAIDGLRPTSDRIRETVFNWLMHDIKDARCLDAFAGSGALGFEAFSRGAAQVVLTEAAPKAYQNLIKQKEAFNDERLLVLKTDARHYLRTTKTQFDIIFLDPPFASQYMKTCIQLLEDNNILTQNGLLYIESPQEIQLHSAYWKPIKLKHAGQVVYGLYQYLKSSASESP